MATKARGYLKDHEMVSHLHALFPPFLQRIAVFQKAIYEFSNAQCLQVDRGPSADSA